MGSQNLLQPNFQTSGYTALNEAQFAAVDLLWALTGFVVLVSIFVHGTTVTPVMRRFDRRWQVKRDSGAQAGVKR